MMSEKQFIESQKEYAKMLGMSLSEYENYCKNLKVSKQTLSEVKDEKEEYDNSILNFLGLTSKDLKTKKSEKCISMEQSKMVEVKIF